MSLDWVWPGIPEQSKIRRDQLLYHWSASLSGRNLCHFLDPGLRVFLKCSSDSNLYQLINFLSACLLILHWFLVMRPSASVLMKILPCSDLLSSLWVIHALDPILSDFAFCSKWMTPIYFVIMDRRELLTLL